MARFSGLVGYAETVETKPGVWEEQFVEVPYKGDVVTHNRKLLSDDQVNDNLTLSTSISIMADQYADANFMNIRYVSWMGAKWKVNTITPARPRLILYLGNLYND